MNNKKTGLEAFVERHRADFDAFEPRPDLWDELERNLAAPAASEEAPLRVVPMHPQPPAATPARWGRRYGAAAAMAALLLAGGGYYWNTAPRLKTWKSAAPMVVITAPEDEPQEVENFFYRGPSPVATAAADAPPQRLAAAVRRMESYYAAQISERKTELGRLDGETAAEAEGEWRKELAALDSTYRQLKMELYRNPEPDVVLDAMNRNLQIRLDILNQQLRTRERMQEYRRSPLMLADGRQMP